MIDGVGIGENVVCLFTEKDNTLKFVFLVQKIPAPVLLLDFIDSLD